MSIYESITLPEISFMYAEYAPEILHSLLIENIINRTADMILIVKTILPH